MKKFGKLDAESTDERLKEKPQDEKAGPKNPVPPIKRPY